jgi:DNA-binding beta-propeller fold protein YncE
MLERVRVGVCAAVVLTLCAIFVINAGAQISDVKNVKTGITTPPEYVNKQWPMSHMKGLLQLTEVIPMPYEGYMDHLAYDLKNMHLFLSVEHGNILSVIDMKTGKIIHETKTSGNPRKPFFDPSTNKLWVNLGGNMVVSLSGTTFEIVDSIELTGGKDAADRDPDNGAYDFAKGLYYVAVRKRTKDAAKDGTIEIVDTKAAKLVGSIRMEVKEPASVTLDTAANKLYVSVGDYENGTSSVKVVDLAKREIVATWPLPGAPNPHAAGFDSVHHRLYLGSRLGGEHRVDPGAMAVINTDTGKVVQVIDSPGGADEVFYDAPTGRIYFSGCTGTLAVYHADDPDHVKLLGTFTTGPVAKSGIWIPELKKYYSAVPKFLALLWPLEKYNTTRDWIVQDSRLMVFDAIP